MSIEYDPKIDDSWKYDPEHNHWGKCYPNEEDCERRGDADEDSQDDGE